MHEHRLGTGVTVPNNHNIKRRDRLWVIFRGIFGGVQMARPCTPSRSSTLALRGVTRSAWQGGARN